jgi:hypothetical protein
MPHGRNNQPQPQVAQVEVMPMNHLRFLSREKLLGYLDEELRHILNAHGLYEIDQYGWLDGGGQDPEFLGHAAWQTSPPELHNLLTLGEEFTNLMRSARHSLGLTCLHHDNEESIFNDNGGGFGFHFTDSANKLNLATDRVREFLITAFARQAPREAKSWPATGKVLGDEGFHNNFCHPFRQIKEEVGAWTESSSPLLECLTKLQPLAAKAALYRAENQDQARHLCFFQERFTEAVSNLDLGYPDEALSESRTNAENSLLLAGLEQWYQVLIQASNLVFLAEHLLRGLTRAETVMTRNPAPRQQVI